MKWLWGIGGFVALMLQLSTAWAALSPQIESKQIRNFTRVTFTWPERIRFRVAPAGDRVTLTFSEPTKISTGKLRSQLGGVLKSANQSADGTQLSLRFDQPYRVRHFLSGRSNGIDILGASAKPKPPEPKPETKKKPLPAPAKKPEPKAEPKVESPKPAETTKVEKPEPKKTVTPADIEPEPAQDTVKAEPVKPVEAVQPEPVKEVATPQAPQPVTKEQAKPEETTMPKQKPPVEPAKEERVAEPPQSPEPEPTAPAPIVEAPTKPDTKPAASMPLKASPSGSAAVKPSQLEPEPAPEALTQAPVREAVDIGGRDTPFLITTYALATGTEIRFPWVKRTGAAVFMREDVLWVIFSEEQRINVPLLQSILPAAVTEVDQIALPGHTALRMQTDGTVYPKVTQPKNTAQWWVTLSIYKQMPASPIAVERRTKSSKPHLYVPTLQYAPPVTLTDPVIGDEIVIVPYFNEGEGVYPGRQFAELELLSSAQGLAAVKKDDFAEVRQLRNGFRIGTREGMQLSDDLPELALAELESLGDSVTWYPYENWRVEPGQFIDVRRELEGQLQAAADVRANSLRLKLAQLYLGEGLANETLAWLKLIEAADPFFFKDRKLEALRGAAHFLNDDYALAKASFRHESLEKDSERNLWFDALAVFERERPRFDYMDYFQTYISKYPPLMREKLGIIAADNYINRRSFSRALKTLDTLSLTGIRDETSPYVYFLLGKIASENNNIEGARELWEPLTDPEGDRFVRATTEFALTTMLYNAGEIDRAEAIERLDRLRVVWRGDTLELTLLNYLGQLYSDDKQYAEALRAWQDLVQNFSDTETAIDVAKKMAETFQFLFSEGGADSMSPLKALATFYEFRQLTPIGEAGDTMIQALANRLAGVDLLGRAAALLEHQIRFRQEKLPRSMLAARLAEIYLADGKPELALEKLELTGFGSMPRELSLRRTRLAALAMADLGEGPRAISMLENDASREADALRLELFWRMKSWPDAIAMGERLLGSRADVTAPLSTPETEQLLQLSIAYMFERNRTQLNYLRNYFEPLMPEGANKDIFLFVTNPGNPVDPQAFGDMNGQIANLESFMQSYRDQLREGGLSGAL